MPHSILPNLNPKIKSRHYITETIQSNSQLTLNSSISHHLSNVLRLKNKNYIRVFNEQCGEFTAQILNVHKQNTTILVLEQYKAYTLPKHHIHLAFAPLKKDATDIVLEKATELGVHEISLIITNRTVNKPLEPSKAYLKMVKATQQCERLDVPQISATCTLDTFLTNQTGSIYWLNEKKVGTSLGAQLQQQFINNPIFLIGPEGGFSDNEITILNNAKNVQSVYFSNNILKAETACLAALIIYQNIAGNL